MSRSSPGHFAIGAAVVSALAASALALALRNGAGDASVWAVTGVLAMALPTVFSGAWLAREIGRPGPSFLFALGAGWALRAVLLSAVVVVALPQGPGALGGSLAGLAVGFIALTVFEMLWFSRRAQRRPLSATGRGA